MDKSNIELFRILFLRKKHIFLATLISIALAYVFTMPLFVKPIYKSTAYVYPANIGLYSEESLTEQLLQFLHSNDIRLYLYKKYNLAKHYKIDTLKKTHMFTYDEFYSEKVSISITKYESVEIKVEDYDPDTARLLVNGIFDAVNLVIEKEVKDKYAGEVQNAKLNVDFAQKEIDSTQHILNELSEKYGIVDMSVQLKEATKAYYKDMNGNAKLNEVITNIGKHGVEFAKLTAYLKYQMKNYALVVGKYEKFLTDFNSNRNHVAVASQPTYPVVASWPKRTIVMIITGISIFILSCIYFVFIDKVKTVYQQVTLKGEKE
ncbi:MAG TPA: Wzz/FepE/Etk N-terminal domain-containing protein [Bacteroidia bacterium]|jgi:capsule polysaccharide export protein KpsE/RkpR|nr:Wzz/FepE/Etk N-terminal domain-containing protein [Bacteroidia bacterium]